MTVAPLQTLEKPAPPAHPSAPAGRVVAVARWSARHRWVALLLWLGFVAAAIVGSSLVPGREMADQGGIGASQAPGDALLAGDFGDAATEHVLVRAEDGGAVDPTDPAVTALHERLADLPSVAAVEGPLPSQDGSAVLLRTVLDIPEGTDAEEEAAARTAATEIAEALTDVGAGLTAGQVGDASLSAAAERLYEDDLRRAEILSLPITLVILVVVFGALLAAAVPVLLALSAVGAAMGLSVLASYLVPSTDMLASVILLVGMAVGVDYSLFYVRRQREERERGAGTADAIVIAASTSGRAVVVSGLAVVVAMAGMFFAGEATFSSLAVGTILVVAVAVLGSLTALPAMLMIFGRWIDRPRVPLLWRLTRSEGDSRFWAAVLRPVLGHPRVALATGVIALLALAAPALGMRLAQPGLADLPGSMPEVATYEAMTEAFPASGAAHTVVVWSPDGGPLDRGAVDRSVADLSSELTSDPRFAVEVPLAAEHATAGDVARVAVPVPFEADDDRAEESVDLLREDLLPAAFGELSGVETGVTGETAANADFRDLVWERMPLIVGFVLLMTVLVLLMAFRSLTVALTAAALNLLSVGAAYGLLTVVFQGTWAETLLGFESTGAVITWIPLFLFVILFGLSMDYHVFVVSRIREAAAAGQPTTEAVRVGVIRSAGVVTSAAVVMVAVFSIFGTLTAIEFKQLAVGLAAAILIDATLIRAVLLPAAMVLLGRRNWWLPRWLTWLPALEGSREPVA